MKRLRDPSLSSTESNAGGIAFWILCAYFATEYVRPQDWFPALESLRLPLLLTASSAAAWLLAGDKSVLRDRLVVQFALFIGLTAFSVAWAVNHYWVAQHTLVLSAYLSAGVLGLAAFAGHPGRLLRFVRVWIGIHVLVAIGSVLHEGRGSGSFLADENDMALTLSVAIPYAYFMALNGSRNRLVSLVWLAAALVMIVGVIATESRGGFLGLVAALVAVVWFSEKRLRNLLVIGVLGVASLQLFVQERYIEEINTITNEQDSTRLSRFYLWRRGWEMFLDNPVLGVASGNFPWTVEKYELRSGERHPRDRLSGGRVAHSLYFTLLPEYGVVGTVLFGMIVVGVYRRLRNTRRRLLESDDPAAAPLVGVSQAALAGLTAYLVSGAFISVLYYPHLWYLLGMAVALDRAVQRVAPAGATASEPMEPRRMRGVMGRRAAAESAND